ncbi:hypothetical protein D9758_008613 [Tetrapyrgos nigripes]|uniref:MYND-type domain-containing protein n=1 Tax=Tetrapyrgos nigripes TaxID=182062 RepID=A0A8H5D525_9AGAR|nr:hypothetical protein D9758_008613 [Tetrapyrgos nigripes]
MPSARHRTGDTKKEMIAAAYRHLRHPVPTVIDPNSPSHDVQLALDYLRMLGERLQCITAGTTLRRATIIEFEKHWPFVWSWTRTFFKQSVLHNEPTTAKGIEFRDILLELLHDVVCFHSPESAWCDPEHMSSLSLMQRTPDLFPTILQAFIFCVDQAHRYLPKIFFLFNISLASSIADPSLFFHNSSLVSNSPEVVKRLVSYIRTEARKQHTDTRLFTSAFGIISSLTKASRKDLDVLLAHGALDCLLWVLKIIINPRRLADLGPDHYAVLIVGNIFQVFLKVTQHHGPSGLVLLLRGDVLRSMINSSALIPYDTDQESFELNRARTLPFYFAKLLGDMPAMLFYRRILHLVLETLDKVDEELLEDFLQTSFLSSSQSNLRKLWDLLCTETTRMKELRDQFESEGIVICFNLDCPRRESQTNYKFRRMHCSRCKLTVYCSKKCQKHDWKVHNHRILCDAAVARVPKYSITDTDLSFLRWYCIKDAETSWEGIGPRVVECREAQGGAMQVVIMDYRQVPRTISIVSVDDYDDERLQELEISQAFVLQLQMQAKQHQSEGYRVVVHGIYHEDGNFSLMFAPPVDV